MILSEKNGWIFPSECNHFAKAFLDGFRKTNYQQKSLDMSYKYIKKFDVAIDVGANLGLMSRRYSETFKSVYSFEPVKSLFECLQKNLDDKNNITFFNYGLGEEENNVTISNLNDLDNFNSGNWSIVDFQNVKDRIISEEIKIKTLDSFGLKPDFIKIDVQSFELEVLKGSLKTIDKYSPVLQIEIQGKLKQESNPIWKILQDYNYSRVEKNNKDYIFVRNEN